MIKFHSLSGWSGTFLNLMVLFIAIDKVSGYINPLKIRGSGIYPIKRNEIGMVFYVNVFNCGTEILTLVTNMLECCEAITDDDSDCEFMKLLGGYMGNLAPGRSRNLTLVFPNIYLHNRRGECLVEVWFKTPQTDPKPIRHRIPFDTTVYRDRILPSMRNFYKPSEVRLCQSPDQDPLENCEPVSCYMKYAGKRNYFNSISLRCDPVPICMSDLEKELPDIAYDPLSNTCCDLEQAITEDDAKFLTRNEVNTQWHSNPPPKISNLRCHHGHLDKQTGLCVCDPGWSTAPVKDDHFIPSTVPFHMCTIQEQGPDLLSRAHEIFKEEFVNFMISLLVVSMIFWSILLYFTATYFIPPPSDWGEDHG